MSLADKLIPVTVYDPRVVEEAPVFPVVKGGSNVDYRQITTGNISSSSIAFNCQSTGDNVYLDRKVHLMVPVRCTFTATGLDPGVLLLNPNQCCVRSFPLHKAIETMNVTINNQSVSVNIADMMSALEHFNMGDDLKNIDMSKCPTYGACQSQDFDDLFGSNRSAMSLYSDGMGDENNAFPFTIVSQTNNGAGVGASTATTVVDFVSTEPLFLSPLSWGPEKDNRAALRGVRSMDINLNFVGNAANRMWALDKDSAGVSYAPASWSSQVQFKDFSPPFSYPDSQPKMLIQYITPQISDQSSGKDRLLTYPYYQVERFPTDLASIAAGASSTASNNQVQLPTIPSKMYVYIRDRNSTLQASPFLPDTFCPIDQLTVQWGTQGTRLGGASQKQLFDLAVKNGFRGNWSSWSGAKLNKAALASAGFGQAAKQFSGLGSIIALSPVDLGLGDLQAPGMQEQFSIQLNATFRNVSSRTIDPTLYFVTVQAGVFSLYNGQGSKKIGLLTAKDILESRKQTGDLMLTFGDVQRMYGGNFFDSLKSGLHKIWSFLGPILKVAAPLLSAVPGPVGEVASVLNPVVQGLGKKGGKRLTKAQLRSRLR